MDENFDLVGAMIATALSAVLLVAGQQYLLKHPEVRENASRSQSVVASNN